MSFNIQETYGAIPCTVKYTVLDASLNTIITRTIVNPPSPPTPPFPTCFTPDPVFVEIEACGTKFRVPIDTNGCCHDVLLYCNCFSTPGWYAFSACLVETPDGPCDYQLNIQI